jgi:hypothetical protein
MANGIIAYGSTVGRLALEAATLFFVATFVFDVIHYWLHRMMKSRIPVFEKLGAMHQAHHEFCDRELHYHDRLAFSNLFRHVVPEYLTQMGVCAVGLMVVDPIAVAVVMFCFTAVFLFVVSMRGIDRNHRPTELLRPARDTILVQPEYHGLHHIYPDSYLSSYTTAFDRIVGTACHIRGRRVALTGASGAFGSAMKTLLEDAGAVVIPLKFGLDYTYEDYTLADAKLETADILILAHGAKGDLAMKANHDSFVALIDRFKSLTADRLMAVEIWGVGSEIECHPAFGIPELISYARSKRAFAREAARLFRDPDVLYRHIVPSAFRSAMGPGLVSGRTMARVTLWLIRHGFRYVPVTYTGIALVNAFPFFLRSAFSPAAVSGRRIVVESSAAV